MKQAIVLPALLSSLLLSTSAIADSPDWSLVQLNYSQIDIDDIDLDPAGFSLTGSMLPTENVILTASFGEIGDNIGPVDFNFFELSLGLGYRFAYSDSTDFYGIISYEYIDAEVSSDSAFEVPNESGTALTVGVRSMYSENLELNANISYIDIVDDSESTLGVGAYYYMADSLALGFGYAVSSDGSTYGVSLRYGF
jgi:hypothetical protein